MRDTIFGQYIFSDSILHRADPRFKIVMLIFAITLTFIIQEFMGLIIFSSFILILSVKAGLKINHFIKIIRFSLVFIFFVFFSSIFKQGTVMHISNLDWEIVIKNSIKVLMIMVISVLITRTTTPLAFVKAVGSICSPLKKIKFINAGEIGFIMVIAVQFIPIILEESEKIIRAHKAKGLELSSYNILERLKYFSILLVPLFISTFRRAESLSMAIESRCFGISGRRTDLDALHFSLVDLKLFVLSFAVSLLAIYSQYFPNINLVAKYFI